MRLARGKNMCGIGTQAAYPTGVTAASPFSGSPRPPSPPSPPAPPPGTVSLDDALFYSGISASVSVVLTVLAALCVCCTSSRGGVLLTIALSALPASCATILYSLHVIADRLPPTVSGSLSKSIEWSTAFACHRGDPSSSSSSACATLAIAHVLSIAAPLWTMALAVHFLGRATCSGAEPPWRCVRALLCEGLPVLATGLLLADHYCTHSPSATCDAVGSPWLPSWAVLAGGLFDVGATASPPGGGQRDTSWLPLVILGAPAATACALGLLAALVGACAANRVSRQAPLDVNGRAILEPFGPSMRELELG